MMIPVNHRGYHITYQGDGTDRCPGCNRQQFHIGRVSAECAFCSTVIPLANTTNVGEGAIVRTVRRGANSLAEVVG